MNNKPKETNDSEQRDESRAFRRAAERAREVAARTGTPLVIYRDGKIELQSVTEVSAATKGDSTTKADLE